MKLYRNLFIFLMALGFLLPNANAQSGWAREKGGLYAQISLSVFSSDRYFNTEGELQRSALGTNYNAYSALFYGEYGITKQLTGLLNAPIYKLNNLSTTETVGGVGDVRLGLKLQPLKEIPISLSVEAEIPTGNGVNLADSKTELAPGIREQINLTTSDGELNIWTTLAASGSVSSGKHYGSVYVSWNKRTKGLSDQLRVGGEYGTLLFDKLWVIGKLQIQKSLADGSKSEIFLFGEGTEYASGELALFYKITDKWRITASYLNYTDIFVTQKNIYDGGSVSLGLALEF